MAELLATREKLPYTLRVSNKELPTLITIVTFSNRGQIAAQREMPSTEVPEVTLLTGTGQDRGKRLARTVSWLGKEGVHAEAIVVPFDQAPATPEAVLAVCR